MPFPILSSLVALPAVGAILLLFVRGDEERSAPASRAIALVVSVLVFAETLLLWSRFNAASGDFHLLSNRSVAARVIASPAVAGNALLLRTTTHLYRLEAGK